MKFFLSDFLLKAVAGAQRPEEADYCLQEAGKSNGECSCSRREEAKCLLFNMVSVVSDIMGNGFKI